MSGQCRRITSAVMYALCSASLMIINKAVLTTYKFPSFQVMALGQMGASITLLTLARCFKLVSIPSLSLESLRKVFPLPLLFLGNQLAGLAGMQNLSIPIFIMLRRLTIVLTMLGEKYMLGTETPWTVVGSVAAMVVGAAIAALNDLSFNALGYVIVLANDLFTAASGIFTKKKLLSKDMDSFSLVYYNAVCMLPVLSAFIYFTEDIQQVYHFEGWMDPVFVLLFALTSIMGFLLNYTMMLCTHYNSALTTYIVGTLKNIVIIYLGMIIGGDYIFTVLNFLGISISATGSVVYSWVTFRRKQPAETSTTAHTVVTSA